jgi:hypothetical protein
MSTVKEKKLREQLLSELHFLEAIYSCSTPLQVRHSINIATDKQLKLLIRVIHLVSSGSIPLKREEFNKIKKAKKLNFINNEFEREKDYKKLLRYSRKDLIHILYKIQAVIPYLISPLLSKK